MLYTQIRICSEEWVTQNTLDSEVQADHHIVAKRPDPVMVDKRKRES